MSDGTHDADMQSLLPEKGAASSSQRVLSWALGRGAPTYAFLTIGLCLVKYGAGLYPSWNLFQALAQNWHNPHASSLLQGPQDYRISDPVSAVLAAWLHLTGARAFLVFHFVLALGALVTPLALPAVRRNTELRLTIFILLIGSAIPAVLLSWIGSYDPVSLAAAAVATLALNPVVAAIGWGVFALNNSSEAFIAFVILAVVLIADQRRHAMRRLIVSAVGLLAGYIWIEIAVSQWGGATSAFALYRFYGFARYAASPENFWPLILVSTLGVGWIFIAARDVRVLPPARLLAGLAIASTIVLPFVALDDSRIISTVMWPGLMLVGVIVVRRLPRARIHELLRTLTPVALLLVIVLVWDNQLVYAGWGGLAHLTRDIVGHSPIPYQN